MENMFKCYVCYVIMQNRVVIAITMNLANLVFKEDFDIYNPLVFVSIFEDGNKRINYKITTQEFLLSLHS